MIPEQDKDLLKFMEIHGWGGAILTPMTSDASARRYARLTNFGKSAVLMDARDVERSQTEKFCQLAELLRAHRMSVPKIYALDLLGGLLILEDFGDQVFAGLMESDKRREVDLYRNAIDALIHLRTLKPPNNLGIASSEVLTCMLDPFFDHYVDENHKDLTIFSALQRQLGDALSVVDHGKRIFSLRDFHSENLMFLEGRRGFASVGLLDFQDAFVCHPAYDLVSLLQDARRRVTAEIEKDMITYYLSKSDDNKENFLFSYRILGVQRNLRILGIFARLARKQSRSHYLALIPRVRGYIHRTISAAEFEAWRDDLMSLLSAPVGDLERAIHV